MEQTMWRYVALCALLLGGPALAQDKPLNEFVHCEREKDCIAKLGGLVQREGHILRLKFANGTTKTFKENRQACDDDDAEECVRYDLRAYLPSQNVFVVEWSGYEERESLVISTRTGRSVELASLPQFSPSGRWFVSVNVNQIDESQYALAIWSTAPDVPKQELRYGARQVLPHEYWQFVGWDGDNRIRLKVGVDPGTGQTREVETSAVHTEHGWALNWPLPGAN
jgi:hypothetical protein